MGEYVSCRRISVRKLEATKAGLSLPKWREPEAAKMEVNIKEFDQIWAAKAVQQEMTEGTLIVRIEDWENISANRLDEYLVTWDN